MDNTAAVGETTSSLVARGAEAILALGDLTVALGIDSVVAEARKGKIPVLSVMPDTVPHGALYASGPDYYTIGKQMGDLLTRVMKGEDIDQDPDPLRYAEGPGDQPDRVAGPEAAMDHPAGGDRQGRDGDPVA